MLSCSIEGMHVVSVDFDSIHLDSFRICISAADLLLDSYLTVLDVEPHGHPQPEAVEVDGDIGIDVAEPDGHDTCFFINTILGCNLFCC